MKQSDFIISYLMTTYYNGKVYKQGQKTPLDKFKKDVEYLAKLNGRTFKWKMDIETSDSSNFIKELEKHAPKDVRSFLNPSHIDIYTANPKGEAFKDRVMVASKVYREVLKRRYMEVGKVRRKSRSEAKAEFGRRRHSNEFIQGMIVALSHL
jgi:hypothetical protein